MVCVTAAFAVSVAAYGQDVPRPEHPRPQMVRAEWLNLNGPWEFVETDEDTEFLGDAEYPDTITVPFCRESKLSGLERLGFVENVWYRRTFTIPAEWTSPRVRLHVGACDYRTRVWVNDTLVGTHVGGSAAFAFDVTAALKDGENTVIIHAFDDTRSGLQASGKQSHREKSYGCVYTRTTGIWQTVWLEGVGASFIKQFAVTPDPNNSRVLVHAEIDGPSMGLTLAAIASAGEKAVGTAETAADWRHTELVIDLTEKRLWAVEDPFLYDLAFVLKKGDQVVDTVNSYFGLRTVSIEGMAILINGEPVFQRTVLDQGFYPEGIWTAPTDAALKHDIELSQAAGFNGARLHQKVFEPRFLYWADTLGYLVWGEFPNWGLDVNNPLVNLPVIDEWVELLLRDRNHPAVIGWCPFNETPPPAGPIQYTVVNVTRAIDPTRPVIESSGYHHGVPDPDVLDAHDYNQTPESFKERWDAQFGVLALPARYGGGPAANVPFFVSEYGGIGWNVEQGAWGYGNNPKTLDELYVRYQGLTDAQLDNRFLFGFCYTQLTNIEQEQNGVYNYQREPKFDIQKIHDINARQAQYEVDPPLVPPATPPAWQLLLGAVPDGESCREWRYTTETPAETWLDCGFDDAGWAVGRAGFGQKGGWEKRIGTKWDTKDIWLRQTFTYAGGTFEHALLVTHYDNAAEVYVNGREVWRGDGWNNEYQGFEVSATLREALRAGDNTVAVHCHQDDGGQFIDLALLVAE